jgi:hypothetical protein
MNHIRRVLATLATLAGALLAFTASAPATFASRIPPPGPTGGPVPPPQVHTVIAGGMPGWQITLIAAAAAAVAAVVAVLADRARTARRNVTARAA